MHGARTGGAVEAYVRVVTREDAVAHDQPAVFGVDGAAGLGTRGGPLSTGASRPRPPKLNSRGIEAGRVRTRLKCLSAPSSA